MRVCKTLNCGKLSKSMHCLKTTEHNKNLCKLFSIKCSFESDVHENTAVRSLSENPVFTGV